MKLLVISHLCYFTEVVSGWNGNRVQAGSGYSNFYSEKMLSAFVVNLEEAEDTQHNKHVWLSLIVMSWGRHHRSCLMDMEFKFAEIKGDKING